MEWCSLASWKRTRRSRLKARRAARITALDRELSWTQKKNPANWSKLHNLDRSKLHQSNKQAPNKVGDSWGKDCQSRGMLCGTCIPTSWQPPGALCYIRQIWLTHGLIPNQRRMSADNPWVNPNSPCNIPKFLTCTMRSQRDKHRTKCPQTHNLHTKVNVQFMKATQRSGTRESTSFKSIFLMYTFKMSTNELQGR